MEPIVTDREKMQYLLDGGVIEYAQSLYKKLNGEGFLAYCTKDGVCTGISSIIDFSDVNIPRPWYESIPEDGTLCFVWNYLDRTDKTISRVFSCSGYPKRYYTATDWFNFAEPLTEGQVDLYNKLISLNP